MNFSYLCPLVRLSCLKKRHLEKYSHWGSKYKREKNTFTHTCGGWACFLGNWHVLQIKFNQFCYLGAVGVYVVVGWGYMRGKRAGCVVFADVVVLNNLVLIDFSFCLIWKVFHFHPFVHLYRYEKLRIKRNESPAQITPWWVSMRYNMSGLNVLKTQGR